MGSVLDGRARQSRSSARSTIHMKMAALFLLCSLAISSRAQEITVAAASDLHPALDEIAAHFQSTNPGKVKIIYGSSGNFYQQIQNGAPFDVFFSANADYPKKL